MICGGILFRALLVMVFGAMYLRSRIRPPVIAPAHPVPVRREPPPPEIIVHKPKLELEPVAPVASEPPAAKAPDDLTVIEGIGPKIAAALSNAGIDTYEKIASRTPAELERIVKAEGVRLIGKADSWPPQAKLAASGDFEGLKAYRRARGK